MNKKINRLTILFAILWIGSGVTAQSNPTPIDRIDCFDYLNTWGYSVVNVNDKYVTMGTCFKGGGAPQSFHISTYDAKGDIINTNFIGSPDGIDNYLVNDFYDIIGLSDSTVLARYSSLFQGSHFVYIYDFVNEEILYQERLERADFPEVTFFVPSLDQKNGTIYLLADSSDGNFAIVKFKDSNLSYSFFENPDENERATEILVSSKFQYYVFSFLGEDLWLTDIRNDTIFSKYQVASNLLVGFVRDAQLSSDGNIVFTTNIRILQNGELKPTRVIVKIDTEGNILWQKNFLNILNTEPQSPNTFIETLIPSVEGDGFIFVGSEFIVEDTTNYANGIIGKISNDGDLIWLKRYRRVAEHLYKNQFYDIDYDGFGGYVAYGTIKYPFLNPWAEKAWLMRIDAEGNPIDTTTSTVDVLEEDLFTVYPNPTTDHFSISSDVHTLSLIDISGNIVLQHQELNKKELLDISFLPSGIYFLKAIDMDKKLVSRKIVKR